MLRFGLDHSFARELPAMHVPWKPAAVPAPQLLYFNDALAIELGLDAAQLRAQGATLFSGAQLPDDARPIAQAYAGHQFGGFSPRLGDGRALLLGERVDSQGLLRDIAFKGSGRTPFARGGDGKAVIGPMLREVLISEAMHALGIPTTRALAVAATGETIPRETPQPGAVLTRVAASHLRVGSFQYALVQGDLEALRKLCDYTIARHDPALLELDAPTRPLALLAAVALRQAQLIARWMNVGFIHGVMNTDNMALSGETIDYGPCAFMDAYDPATVFSSIDHGGRYAYANQPLIARWNLARFAETLLPLMADPDDEAAVQRVVAQVTEIIDAFPGHYAAALLQGRRAKLGLLAARNDDDAEDAALVQDWLTLLQTQAADFTQSWHALDAAAQRDEAPLRALFAEAATLETWLQRWRERLARDDAALALAEPAGDRATGAIDRASQRAACMRQANPRIIPRNHRVEEALAAATAGDLAPFERLLDALLRPFDNAPQLADFAEPAPASLAAGYQTFCGT